MPGRPDVPPGGGPRRRDLAGPLWRAVAWVLVTGRWLILPGWLVGAAAAAMFLPGISQAANTGTGDIVPASAPALRAQADATRLFGFSLTSPAQMVQRNPAGLSSAAQERAVARAVSITQQRLPGFRGILGAVPLLNTLGIVPGSRERSTTAVTYLYFRSGTTWGEQTALAERLARQTAGRPADHLVGITGAVPARLAQSDIILARLPWVEVLTVALIAVIIGLYFRSVGPPTAVLLCAAIAYVIAVHVIAWLGNRLGAPIPTEFEPVLVVLLLGVVTDYSVFFLAGMRRELSTGEKAARAARRTTAEFLPIILTAGLIVAAGTAALGVAKVQFLRAFGPGLALTVLVALAVAVTLMPALLALFGRLLYWPRFAHGKAEQADDDGSRRRAVRGRIAWWGTAKPVSLAVAAICLVALGAAAWGMRGVRLGFPLIRSLPANTQEARAYAAASEGFAPGVLAPTEVILKAPGVGHDRAAAAAIERALARQPGVAGVLGPADLPPGVNPRAVVAPGGDAVRFAVLFDSDPLGGVAADHLRALEQRMPGVIASAGVRGAAVEYAGYTALTVDTISSTLRDLGRVAGVMLAVDFVLLALFLRSVVAPLYLLAASILGLGAALGLTTLVFQHALGGQDLVFYVPLVAAVLLVSLGSDYNVFVVGRIWEQARRGPLREAVAVAAPRAARAINVAGVALAGSFAVLAIVPLGQFREFAFAVTVGVLVDAWIVRSLLVPALITLFGRVGGWPGNRLAGTTERRPPRSAT